VTGFEVAYFQWEEGERRLRAVDPAQRSAAETAAAAVVDELRRRLGGPFTAAELAELYAAGTDWCTEVAMRAAPEHPAAWDGATVADAAFHRYLREAEDYAGGRTIA